MFNIGKIKQPRCNVFKVKCDTVFSNEKEEETQQIITEAPVEKKYIPGERLLKKIDKTRQAKRSKAAEAKKNDHFDDDDIDRIRKSMGALLKVF
jgi:hypothetical protein